MANLLHSRAIIWLCLIVGLLAIAKVLVIQQYRSTPTAKPAEVRIDKKDLDASQLPEKFPADLPLEAGAKVTQNYNITTDDGRFQATRTFETSKTLEENVKIYTDYFNKNGWQAGTAIDNKDSKVLSATKGGSSLQIAISQNPVTQIKTVNIS